MHYSDRIHLSKFSYHSDDDPFFDEDCFQDIEWDGELNQFMDMTDLAEPGDLFWDEN